MSFLYTYSHVVLAYMLLIVNQPKSNILFPTNSTYVMHKIHLMKFYKCTVTLKTMFLVLKPNTYKCVCVCVCVFVYITIYIYYIVDI